MDRPPGSAGNYELLTLEATGDYDGAKKMLTELSVIRPEVRKALDRLKSVPTDIAPIFITANALTQEKLPGEGSVGTSL